MKTKLFTICLFTAFAGVAFAGFRDPSGGAGERPMELDTATPRNLAPAGVAPSRAPASPVSAVYGPMPPPGFKAQPQRNVPQPGRQAGPSSWPVPTAPQLPSRSKTEIPQLRLPGQNTITILRDPLPPIQVQSRSRADIRKFSEQARRMPVPSRAYEEKPRSAEIASRYSSALRILKHKPIRTPLRLSLDNTAKIQNPPSPTQYENMVKRLDALFAGLNLSYPSGIQSLWELSRSQTNARPLQARDALFAGILSRRNGWETTAGNLMEDAANKKIASEERYLKILWNELQQLDSLFQIERVVSRVDPAMAAKAAPLGDKPNFALAKRALTGRIPAKSGLDAATLQERIGSAVYRERLTLMQALASLRTGNGKEEEAYATLHELESLGQPEVKEEARLALARALLRKGETGSALEFYRNVKKTGKNRLEVLGEQSYAELRSGLHQDSLGKAMGLQSPYFQFGFAPDIHLIEILSRKSLCDFGGAEAGIQRFQERYAAEASSLGALLADPTSPQEFYKELISYHGEANPRRYQRYLLRLPVVMENQKILNSAHEELEKISDLGKEKYTEARPAGWDQFAASMKDSWSKSALSVKEESASAALSEAAYMLQRLRNTFKQLELLSLDISTSATRNYNLQSAMNFPVRKLASAAVEENRFHWPFEDEIWEDELDFLKMKNPTKCASSFLAKPEEEAN